MKIILMMITITGEDYSGDDDNNDVIDYDRDNDKSHYFHDTNYLTSKRL